MIPEGRRLGAVLLADMVAYSARMHESESHALALLDVLWSQLRPLIARHDGREIKTIGDAILAEFSGALAATQCAIEAHAALHAHNREAPPESQIFVRIGVHLGDIEHRDRDVFGDGVNICARIQPLAPPGGTAVTRHVYDQVRSALKAEYRLLGPCLLKNIAQPVEVFTVRGPDHDLAVQAQPLDPGVGSFRRWSFGKALLDERALQLTVDGQAVKLERKSLEVLLFLLNHAGEVVTKDEILENVWPGRVLSDTVLTKCVSRIRDVLDDGEQAIVKTVHGYGYRFVAGVHGEGATAAPPARFDFQAGDHPVHRPLWSLVRRLGTGGHGEAWLVRHDKTREERVFKFAVGPAHIVSLKREITLYRLLKDSLPGEQPSVKVLEWNLEEVPYFLELEYLAGGSLEQWAAARGGLDQVPLEERIEIAAQIAEALALAHSVGVLHKDLKPSNVLLESAEGPPKVKLGDFGSGGMLEPDRLEALGITRLGFTQTIRMDSSSGTPLYLAPEVLAGQPTTVQGDIYALGVMLYQLLAGDLRKPLAPGWEQDIEDELLREDIAEAAAGNPIKRLADPGELAARLRTLADRRENRARERDEAQRHERARRAHEQARRWRAVAGVLLVLSLIAVTASVVAARALREAQARERELAQVATFQESLLGRTDVARMGVGLMSELRSQLIGDNASEPTPQVQRRMDIFEELAPVLRPSDLAVEILAQHVLQPAGTAADAEFKNLPLVRAKLKRSIAKSFRDLGRPDAARHAIEEAIALQSLSLGEAAEETLASRKVFVAVLADQNDAQARAEAEGVYQSRLQLLGPDHVDTLTSRHDWVGILAMTDDPQSLAEGRASLQAHRRALGSEHPQTLRAMNTAAVMIANAGAGEEARALQREALEAQRRVLGPEHKDTVLSMHNLGVALVLANELAEGRALLEQVLEIHRRLLGSDHPTVLADMNNLAYTLSEQGELAAARALWEQGLDTERRLLGRDHPQTFISGRNLVRTLLSMGETRAAHELIMQLIESARRSVGPDDPKTARLRQSLAHVLEAERDFRGAEASARSALATQEARLGSEHRDVLATLRILARVTAAQGRHAEALALFDRAMPLAERLQGSKHPDTIALSAERQQAAQPAPAPGIAPLLTTTP